MHTYFRFAIALASLCVTGTAVAFDPAGRVVVKFHDHTLARAQPAVALRTLAPEARPVIRLANGAQVLRVDQGGADALIARLAANPDVQYVMRDPLLQHTVVIDDPWYEGRVEVGGREYSRTRPTCTIRAAASMRLPHGRRARWARASSWRCWTRGSPHIRISTRMSSQARATISSPMPSFPGARTTRGARWLKFQVSSHRAGAASGGLGDEVVAGAFDDVRVEVRMRGDARVHHGDHDALARRALRPCGGRVDAARGS